MSDLRIEAIKGCETCVHYTETSWGYPYCKRYQLEQIDYIQGKIDQTPYTCIYARESEKLCGHQARGYEFKASGEPLSLWGALKNAFIELFTPFAK